jgi:hypothetical protein
MLRIYMIFINNNLTKLQALNKQQKPLFTLTAQTRLKNGTVCAIKKLASQTNLFLNAGLNTNALNQKTNKELNQSLIKILATRVIQLENNKFNKLYLKDKGSYTASGIAKVSPYLGKPLNLINLDNSLNVSTNIPQVNKGIDIYRPPTTSYKHGKTNKDLAIFNADLFLADNAVNQKPQAKTSLNKERVVHTRKIQRSNSKEFNQGTLLNLKQTNFIKNLTLLNCYYGKGLPISEQSKGFVQGCKNSNFDYINNIQTTDNLKVQPSIFNYIFLKTSPQSLPFLQKIMVILLRRSPAGDQSLAYSAMNSCCPLRLLPPIPKGEAGIPKGEAMQAGFKQLDAGSSRYALTHKKQEQSSLNKQKVFSSLYKPNIYFNTLNNLKTGYSNSNGLSLAKTSVSKNSLSNPIGLAYFSQKKSFLSYWLIPFMGFYTILANSTFNESVNALALNNINILKQTTVLVTSNIQPQNTASQSSLSNQSNIHNQQNQTNLLPLQQIWFSNSVNNVFQKGLKGLQGITEQARMGSHMLASQPEGRPSLSNPLRLVQTYKFDNTFTNNISTDLDILAIAYLNSHSNTSFDQRAKAYEAHGLDNVFTNDLHKQVGLEGLRSKIFTGLHKLPPGEMQAKQAKQTLKTTHKLKKSMFLWYWNNLNTFYSNAQALPSVHKEGLAANTPSLNTNFTPINSSLKHNYSLKTTQGFNSFALDRLAHTWANQAKHSNHGINLNPNKALNLNHLQLLKSWFPEFKDSALAIPLSGIAKAKQQGFTKLNTLISFKLVNGLSLNQGFFSGATTANLWHRSPEGKDKKPTKSLNTNHFILVSGTNVSFSGFGLKGLLASSPRDPHSETRREPVQTNKYVKTFASYKSRGFKGLLKNLQNRSISTPITDYKQVSVFLDKLITNYNWSLVNGRLTANAVNQKFQDNKAPELNTLVLNHDLFSAAEFVMKPSFLNQGVTQTLPTDVLFHKKYILNLLNNKVNNLKLNNLSAEVNALALNQTNSLDLNKPFKSNRAFDSNLDSIYSFLLKKQYSKTKINSVTNLQNPITEYNGFRFIKLKNPICTSSNFSGLQNNYSTRISSNNMLEERLAHTWLAERAEGKEQNHKNAAKPTNYNPFLNIYNNQNNLKGKVCTSLCKPNNTELSPDLHKSGRFTGLPGLEVRTYLGKPADMGNPLSPVQNHKSFTNLSTTNVASTPHVLNQDNQGSVVQQTKLFNNYVKYIQYKIKHFIFNTNTLNVINSKNSTNILQKEWFSGFKGFKDLYGPSQAHKAYANSFNNSKPIKSSNAKSKAFAKEFNLALAKQTHQIKYNYSKALPLILKHKTFFKIAPPFGRPLCGTPAQKLDSIKPTITKSIWYDPSYTDKERLNAKAFNHNNLNTMHSTNYMDPSYTKYINTKKEIQQKRKAKKQRLESRRQKKRKRFYPRPTWLRLRLGLKIAGSQLNQFVKQKKNLNSFFNAKALNNVKALNNAKALVNSLYNLDHLKSGLTNNPLFNLKKFKNIYSTNSSMDSKFQKAKTTYLYNNMVLNLWTNAKKVKNLNQSMLRQGSLRFRKAEAEQQKQLKNNGYLKNRFYTSKKALINFKTINSKQYVNFEKPSNTNIPKKTENNSLRDFWIWLYNITSTNTWNQSFLNPFISQIGISLHMPRGSAQAYAKQRFNSLELNQNKTSGLGFASHSINSSLDQTNLIAKGEAGMRSNKNLNTWGTNKFDKRFAQACANQTLNIQPNIKPLNWALNKTNYWSSTTKRLNLWTSQKLRNQSKNNKTKYIEKRLKNKINTGLSSIYLKSLTKDYKRSCFRSVALLRFDTIDTSAKSLNKLNNTFYKALLSQKLHQKEQKLAYLASIQKKDFSFTKKIQIRSFPSGEARSSLRERANNKVNSSGFNNTFISKPTVNLAWWRGKSKAKQKNGYFAQHVYPSFNSSFKIVNGLAGMQDHNFVDTLKNQSIAQVTLNQDNSLFIKQNNNNINQSNSKAFSSPLRDNWLESTESNLGLNLFSNYNITIVSLLFHFCALISLVSISQIRCFIKFHYILIHKLSNIYLELIYKNLNLTQKALRSTNIIKSKSNTSGLNNSLYQKITPLFSQRLNNVNTINYTNLLFLNSIMPNRVYNQKLNIAKVFKFTKNNKFKALPGKISTSQYKPNLQTHMPLLASSFPSGLRNPSGAKQTDTLVQTKQLNKFLLLQNLNKIKALKSLQNNNYIDLQQSAVPIYSTTQKFNNIESKNLNSSPIRFKGLSKINNKRILQAWENQTNALALKTNLNNPIKGLDTLVGLYRHVQTSQTKNWVVTSLLQSFINFVKGLYMLVQTKQLYLSTALKNSNAELEFKDSASSFSSGLRNQTINGNLANKQIISKGLLNKKLLNIKALYYQLELTEYNTKTTKAMQKFAVNTSYKVVYSFEYVLRIIYSFFEKPAELTMDWIAYAFLVEWSSDLLAFTPEKTEKQVWYTFEKVSRQSKIWFNANTLSPTFIQNNGFIQSPIINSTVTNSVLLLWNLILGQLLYKRILYFNDMFLEILNRPDSDLLNRQKKGALFWDIWSDILIKAADKYNVNVPSLSNIKEEQNVLIDKFLADNNILTTKTKMDVTKKIIAGFNSASQTLNRGKKQKYNHLSNSQLKGIKGFAKQRLAHTLANHMLAPPFGIPLCGTPRIKTTKFNNSLNQNNIEYTSLLPDAKLNQFVNNNSIDINQFVTYQSKENDLFLDYHPPKSFAHISAIRYYNLVQQPLGTIVCQIYSGLFTKQISKNVLVIGSTLNTSTNTALERTQKTLLIQALAGETEIKIITDNASRYAIVNRGFAVGIKLLKDVFEAISLNTPCFFLLEDIHLIGERRPLLISDSGSDNASGDELSKSTDYTFGSQRNGEAVHEKNQILYQLSMHGITHYKKPFKGDFSLSIPTNHFSFDLFLKQATRHKSSTIPTHPLAYSLNSLEIDKISSPGQSTQNSEYSLTNTLQKITSNRSTIALAQQDFDIINKNKPLGSSLQLASNNLNKLLSPPSTSPFTVLLLKEQKKLKPKKTVKELPWLGLSNSEQQLGSAVAGSSRISYSVRAKVAALADLSFSNMSAKLDMITDLLVIIDSVRGNRGFVVFATTHLPHILDPALRRPGRLDETICIPTLSNIWTRWEFTKTTEPILSGLNGLLPNVQTLNTLNTNGYNLINNLSLFASRLNFITRSASKTILGYNGTIDHLDFINLDFVNSLRDQNTNIFSSIVTANYSVQKQTLNTLFSSAASAKRNPKGNSGLPKYGQTFQSLKRKYLINGLTNNKNFNFKKQIKQMFNISYNQIGKKLITNKYSFILSSLTPSYYNQSTLESTISLTETNSYLMNLLQYNSLYSSTNLIQNTICALLSGKLSEGFVNSGVLKNLVLMSSFKNKAKTKNSKYNTNSVVPQSRREGRTSQSGRLACRSAEHDFVKTQNAKFPATQLEGHYLAVQDIASNIISLYGIDQTWRAATSLALSFVQKRYLYNKNLIVPKLLNFIDNSSLEEPPSPPLSNILIPAKRYENAKKTLKENIERKVSVSIIEKLETHNKQAYIKSIYKTNQNNQSRPNIVNTNSLAALGNYKNPLSAISSANWHYQSKILKRHRNYLNNQWWNGQLTEHSSEALFLSDIDWRFTFIDNMNTPSIMTAATKNQRIFFNKLKNKVYNLNGGAQGEAELNTASPFSRREGSESNAKQELNLSLELNQTKNNLNFMDTKLNRKGINSNINSTSFKQNNSDKPFKDILIDFPDAEQHYNPRHRRWMLTYGTWSSWFSMDQTLQTEIFNHLIFESVVKSYMLLDQNRELLDYTVSKYMTKGLLKELYLNSAIRKF